MKISKIRKFAFDLFERRFRKVTINDRDWVTAICTKDGGMGAHVHFYSLFLTQEMYPYDSFRTLCGCLVKRPWLGENGDLMCQYPIGAAEDRKKAVREMIRLYGWQSDNIRFFGMSETTLQELQEQYGQKVSDVVNDRDAQEYILKVDEFIALEGSRFSNLRTKMRRFDRNTNWSYEKITEKNLPECIDLAQRWYATHTDEESAVSEQRAAKVVFENYFRDGYVGGLIRIDGNVAVFNVGVPFSNKMFVNVIRKADNAYRDATMTMVYEFIKENCQSYEYVNDSCDMGLPGLRTFKTLLQPNYMNPFYFATVSLR